MQVIHPNNHRTPNEMRSVQFVIKYQKPVHCFVRYPWRAVVHVKDNPGWQDDLIPYKQHYCSTNSCYPGCDRQVSHSASQFAVSIYQNHLPRLLLTTVTQWWIVSIQWFEGTNIGCINIQDIAVIQRRQYSVLNDDVCAFKVKTGSDYLLCLWKKQKKILN